MSEPQFEVLVGADPVTGQLPAPTEARMDTVVAEHIDNPDSDTRASLNATYVAHVAAIVGETASATVTRLNAALAAGGTVRLSGAFTVNAPLVIPSNTTLDATAATVTATHAGNILQNYEVVADASRDKAIIVHGGHWARTVSMGGASGTDLHLMVFRRVDNITISDVSVETTAGKYAINLGDVTQFTVRRITCDTFSDGVHVNGPASRGVITEIYGTAGDDTVALTANDYTAYADVTGNITGVSISAIHASSSKSIVKVLPGLGMVVDAITIRDVTGESTTSLPTVWVGDDTGNASTTGGTVGCVTIDSVHATLGANPLSISGIPVASITFRGSSYIGTVADKGGINIVGNASVDQLIVNGYRVSGSVTSLTAMAQSGSSTIVKSMLVLGSTLTSTATQPAFLLLSAGTIGALTLDGLQIDSTGAATGTNVIDMRSTATLSHLAVIGGRYKAIRCVVTSASTSPALAITIAGAFFDAPNRLANLYGPTDITLAGLRVVSAVNDLFYLAHANATLSIRGTGFTQVTSTKQLVWRSASQVIHYESLDLPVQADILTKTAGDRAFNTKGALSCGVGLIITDGTTWKNLYSGATY